MTFICRIKQSKKRFSCLIMKMKHLLHFETMGALYRRSYHYIPEDISDGLKSGNLLFCCCVYCCIAVCCGTYELQDAKEEHKILSGRLKILRINNFCATH